MALLISGDVYVLINYVQFAEALFITISVLGLLYMRYTLKSATRPIKVNYVLPVIFLVICAFLVIFPCYASPVEVGVGLAIILLGIPVYYVTIAWTTKPKWLQKLFDGFNGSCEKLFLCIPEQVYEKKL